MVTVALAVQYGQSDCAGMDRSEGYPELSNSSTFPPTRRRVSVWNGDDGGVLKPRWLVRRNLASVMIIARTVVAAPLVKDE